MPTSVNNSCCLRKKQCMLHGKTGFWLPAAVFSARVLTLDRLGLKSTLAEKKYGGQKKLLYLPRCIITIFRGAYIVFYAGSSYYWPTWAFFLQGSVQLQLSILPSSPIFHNLNN
jgi:hypothetical protein